jgi:hypothetical protein
MQLSSHKMIVDVVRSSLLKLFYLNPFVVLFCICWYDDDRGTRSIQRLSGELPLELESDAQLLPLSDGAGADKDGKTLKRRSNFDLYYTLARERVSSRWSATRNRRSLVALTTLLLATAAIFAFMRGAASSTLSRDRSRDADASLLLLLSSSLNSSAIAALSIASSNYWPDVPFLAPADRMAVALDDAPTLFGDDFVATPRFQASSLLRANTDPYRILLDSFQSQYNRRRLTSDEVMRNFNVLVDVNDTFCCVVGTRSAKSTKSHSRDTAT